MHSYFGALLKHYAQVNGVRLVQVAQAAGLAPARLSRLMRDLEGTGDDARPVVLSYGQITRIVTAASPHRHEQINMLVGYLYDIVPPVFREGIEIRTLREGPSEPRGQGAESEPAAFAEQAPPDGQAASRAPLETSPASSRSPAA